MVYKFKIKQTREKTYFAPEKPTVNKDECGIIKQLPENVDQKRQNLCNNSWVCGMILRHNVERQCKIKNATNPVVQPVISPELTPCDFLLISQLELLILERHSLKGIIKNS